MCYARRALERKSSSIYPYAYCTQELLNLGTRAICSLARGAPAQLFSRSIARPKSSRSAVCASELSGRLKCGR